MRVNIADDSARFAYDNWLGWAAYLEVAEELTGLGSSDMLGPDNKPAGLSVNVNHCNKKYYMFHNATDSLSPLLGLPYWEHEFTYVMHGDVSLWNRWHSFCETEQVNH